jgi:vesicle-fusing ATPase
VLLEGDIGAGKTSIAAWAAIGSGFPYVKLISPELFIGLTEGNNWIILLLGATIN